MLGHNRSFESEVTGTGVSDRVGKWLDRAEADRKDMSKTEVIEAVQTDPIDSFSEITRRGEALRRRSESDIKALGHRAISDRRELAA
jgi:hypothetical protein